jgi:hypothetical protein
MSINLLQDKGTALHRQDFTWKDLLGQGIWPVDFRRRSRKKTGTLPRCGRGMEQICLNEAGVQ